MLRLKTHENYPHPIKVSSCLQVRAFPSRWWSRRERDRGRLERVLKDARARKRSTITIPQIFVTRLNRENSSFKSRNSILTVRRIV